MSRAGTKSSQGDDFQRAIAINWIICMLSDTDIDYIQAESNGIKGFSERVTVDDIVIVYKNKHRRYIQAKKNQSKNRAWSFADLGDELVKSKEQLCADRSALVIFYSATPFGDFKSLADACNEYPDFAAFERGAGKAKNNSLADLAKRWQETVPNSFELVARIEFGSHHNFAEWQRQNRQELARLVTNPDTALAVLESLVNAHQSKWPGTNFEIRKEQVLNELRKHGIILTPTYVVQDILNKFAKISLIGRSWSRSVGGKQITRPELAEVLQSIKEHQEAILIVDRAGSGKTCLLLDIVEQLESAENSALLFLKGDQFIDKEEREEILPKDLVEMCARLAESRSLVIIIDSLDVLSLNRNSGSLNYFLNLIDRLQGIANISLIAACRTFDLQYDAKLRDRKWSKKIQLVDFDFNSVVAPLLSEWGVKVENLNNELKQLLCLPQHLRLFESIAGLKRGLEIRNPYELQEVFLNECVSKHPNLGTTGLQNLQQFAHQLLSSRSHQLPVTQFPGEESIRRHLISQNVLFENSGKIAFSHQTLFDTLTVQHAFANNQNLLCFILSHPPLPFLRASVQSFIFHLRIYNSEQFSRQITQVLNHEKVAYHLKRLTVESIATLHIDPKEDWPLIRRIFQEHPPLFERMLRKTTGDGWFRLLLDSWLPSLQSADQHWKSTFLQQLEQWKNSFPDEVVELWLQAINESWLKENVHNFIIPQLACFTKWHVKEISTLLELISSKAQHEHGLFLNVLSHYATSTRDGDPLLWQFMTRKVTNADISRFKLGNQLSCKFQDKSFLSKHLEHSCNFLDQVLSSLETWAYHKKTSDQKLNSAFIYHCPSYDQRHSCRDLYHLDNLALLLQALENAFHTHASKNTAWWQTNEPMLRNSNLLILLYLLIKPYSDSPERHIDGIITLLTNAEFFRHRCLDYEIGQLMNACYFLLPETVQLENQRIVLDLYNDTDWIAPQENGELPEWVYEVRYRYLLWIPVIYRTLESQSFVNQFEKCFGRFPPEPDIVGRGGVVGYPLSLEEMLSFTDTTLVSYCKHYEGYDDIFGNHPGDYLRGGQDMVQRRLIEAAAYDPARYLTVIPLFIASGLSAGYVQHIIYGVADHIRHRFGNLKPTSGKFQCIQPEPEGESLAEQLLIFLEEKWLWTDTRQLNLFNIPAACCEVLRQPELTEKLVFILFQHLFQLRVSQAKNSPEITQDSGDNALKNVRFDAINSDWGYFGRGVARLCTRLLEEEQNIPELLFPLLRHLVKASEKAAIMIIDHIPYITYKRPEWGFQLFSDIYDNNPPTHLWEAAQQHLYYQYHRNFEYVQPYLERMLQSGNPKVLKSWGLLSTMSHLSGHISQDQLFENLAAVNQEAVWLAATQVFAANLDKHTQDRLCISGLTHILELELGLPSVIVKIEHAFDPKKQGGCLDFDFAQLYIEKANFNEYRFNMKRLFGWIADLSNRDPLAALKLMEILAEKLSEKSAGSLYSGKSLIQALNTLLREADETDDEVLISRVIAVQDKLLQLGLHGIEEFFTAVEKN